MVQSDIDAVTARRAMVVRELAALELTRQELNAEDEELEVAERVLLRLEDFFQAEEPAFAPQPHHAFNDGLTRIGAIAALWHELPARLSDKYQTLHTRIRDASTRLFS